MGLEAGTRGSVVKRVSLAGLRRRVVCRHDLKPQTLAAAAAAAARRL